MNKKEFYHLIQTIEEEGEKDGNIHFVVWDANRKECVPLYFKSVDPKNDIGDTIIEFTYNNYTRRLL